MNSKFDDYDPSAARNGEPLGGGGPVGPSKSISNLCKKTANCKLDTSLGSKPSGRAGDVIYECFLCRLTNPGLMLLVVVCGLTKSGIGGGILRNNVAYTLSYRNYSGISMQNWLVPYHYVQCIVNL